MISALVTGRLVYCDRVTDKVQGVIADRQGSHVNFQSSKKRVCETVADLPHGTPVVMSGDLLVTLRPNSRGGQQAHIELFATSAITPITDAIRHEWRALNEEITND